MQMKDLQVLIEEFQIRPNGNVRARKVPLSEKMKADEQWQGAAMRAVQQELRTVLPSDP